MKAIATNSTGTMLNNETGTLVEKQNGPKHFSIHKQQQSNQKPEITQEERKFSYQGNGMEGTQCNALDCFFSFHCGAVAKTRNYLQPPVCKFFHVKKHVQ
jgi:hypothetical protein